MSASSRPTGTTRSGTSTRSRSRPSLRIACGRDGAGRLVQEDVGERLSLDAFSVDLDPVAGRDEGVELSLLAVDSHPPRLDQLVRRAARRDAGPGEIGVQAHRAVYSPGAALRDADALDDAGLPGLPKWRERIEEGERVITDAGGTLVGVYVTLGRYDVVEIFEAPDDDIAMEILMKLNRYGAEHTETLRAFSPDEAEAIVRRL